MFGYLHYGGDALMCLTKTPRLDSGTALRSVSNGQQDARAITQNEGTSYDVDENKG
jgi:hypothetical protein